MLPLGSKSPSFLTWIITVIFKLVSLLTCHYTMYSNAIVRMILLKCKSDWITPIFKTLQRFLMSSKPIAPWLAKVPHPVLISLLQVLYPQAYRIPISLAFILFCMVHLCLRTPSLVISSSWYDPFLVNGLLSIEHLLKCHFFKWGPFKTLCHPPAVLILMVLLSSYIILYTI